MLTQTDLINKFTNTLPKKESESDIYFAHFSMDGLEEIHRYSKDERLYEFFEFDPFKGISETKAYIEKLLQRMSGQSGEKSTMYWFVRRKCDDRLVGTATLVNLNYARQSIEWGYGVDPELWGNGYVLQIQEILKYFTFDVLEFHRLHGITMVENKRTIQSVLASGMKHEGVLRDFYCKNGVYHDGWQYGMIAHDYFDVQQKNKQAIGSKVTKDDIVKVIASVLTEEDVDVATNMENTYSWDSLSHMAVIVALKEHFAINFKPSEIYAMTSVKSIFKKVNESK